jgi:hypothetical protein
MACHEAQDAVVFASAVVPPRRERVFTLLFRAALGAPAASKARLALEQQDLTSDAAAWALQRNVFRATAALADYRDLADERCPRAAPSHGHAALALAYMRRIPAPGATPSPTATAARPAPQAPRPGTRQPVRLASRPDPAPPPSSSRRAHTVSRLKPAHRSRRDVCLRSIFAPSRVLRPLARGNRPWHTHCVLLRSTGGHRSASPRFPSDMSVMRTHFVAVRPRVGVSVLLCIRRALWRQLCRPDLSAAS